MAVQEDVPGLRVVVGDAGRDAVLVRDYNAGGPILVLRDGPSREALDAAIALVLPTMHPTERLRIINTYVPHAADLGELTRPTRAFRARPPDGKEPTRVAVLALAALTLIGTVVGCALYLLGYAAGVAQPDRNDLPAYMTPFGGPMFARFEAAGGRCEEASDNPLRARCVDSRGEVTSAEAAIGPDYITYLFLGGEDRTAIRINRDSAAAKTYVHQALKGVTRVGRFVVWGSDEEIVDYFATILRK